MHIAQHVATRLHCCQANRRASNQGICAVGCSYNSCMTHPTDICRPLHPPPLKLPARNLPSICVIISLLSVAVSLPLPQRPAPMAVPPRHGLSSGASIRKLESACASLRPAPSAEWGRIAGELYPERLLPRCDDRAALITDATSPSCSSTPGRLLAVLPRGEASPSADNFAIADAGRAMCLRTDGDSPLYTLRVSSLF